VAQWIDHVTISRCGTLLHDMAFERTFRRLPRRVPGHAFVAPWDDVHLQPPPSLLLSSGARCPRPHPPGAPPDQGVSTATKKEASRCGQTEAKRYKQTKASRCNQTEASRCRKKSRVASKIYSSHTRKTRCRRHRPRKPDAMIPPAMRHQCDRRRVQGVLLGRRISRSSSSSLEEKR